MSMRMLGRGAFALSLMLTCTAQADEFSGPYLGGSLGQARLQVDDADFNETDMAFKVFAGYAFSDLLALEATYFDSGEPTLEVADVGAVRASVSGVNASILLRARKGSAFAFFLKLGYSSYDTEVEAVVGGAVVLQATDTREDFTYGIGASYLFSQKFMVRLELEALDIEDADFNLLTMGAGYKF